MEENQGVQVPGEDDKSSMNPNIATDLHVDRAKVKGWKPLEEFKGDPADWIDAKEFLVREPLLKEIRDLKKHIRTERERTESDMRIISTQFSEMNRMAYDKAVADLELQRDLAIQEQDITTVRALDKKIDTVKDDHQKVQAQTRPQIRQQAVQTEEMEQWRADNAWFDSDQELQDEAVAIGVGYLAKNPNKTQGQMLKHVEDRIQKIYPEKFKKQQTRTSVEDNNDTKVESGGTSRPSPNRQGRGLKVSDLDDDEKAVMRTLLKRGVLKDVAAKNKRSEQDEFLAQLAERKAK